MVRLLYAFVLGIPVASAAVAPPTVPEVTVTAKPPSGQLGRWITEICPRTEGLTPALNDFIFSRLKAVAASVWAPHQWPAQCRPNVGIESIAMTAGDTAYLRALYSLDMELPLSLQRMDIQSKMMREFQARASND